MQLTTRHHHPPEINFNPDADRLQEGARNARSSAKRKIRIGYDPMAKIFKSKLIFLVGPRTLNFAALAELL
jgi:hypothetical protein